MHSSFETVHAVFPVMQMFTREYQGLNFKFRFNTNILPYCFVFGQKLKIRFRGNQKQNGKF